MNTRKSLYLNLNPKTICLVTKAIHSLTKQDDGFNNF